MNTTHTTSKRLVAALGAVAAAAAPALLFTGAGTAHAEDPACYGALQGSFYCSPGQNNYQSPQEDMYKPLPPTVTLPGCTGGTLAALGGLLSGDGCS